MAVRRKADIDRNDEWEQMEVKVQNYKVSAVSNEQLELAYGETTAYGMLTKYDTGEYSTEGQSRSYKVFQRFRKSCERS